MSVDHNAVISDLEQKRARLDDVIVLLRDLYGSPATPPLKACAPQKNRRKPKAVALKEDDGCRSAPVLDAILEALAHGPMTSIETFEVLRKAGVTTVAGSVYQGLRRLLDRGSVEKAKNDEGITAWTLVK